jgi:hypothetical protein
LSRSVIGSAGPPGGGSKQTESVLKNGQVRAST